MGNTRGDDIVLDLFKEKIEGAIDIGTSSIKALKLKKSKIELFDLKELKHGTIVNGGIEDYLEVTEELLDILGIKDKIKINVVTSEYFKDIYFAERPPCERLENRKLNIREANLMRDWKVALKEYIDNYYQGYLD